MKKKLALILMILSAALFMTVCCSAADALGGQVIIIGQNGINDLKGAVAALRQNAGNAVIYLNGSITMGEQVELPADLSGLKSVTLAAYNNSRSVVSMNGSVICANGIPLAVGQNVSLSNGFLVGGSCSAQPGTALLESTMLIIDGSADLVIGGGLAMGNGVVSSVKNTNIIISGNAQSVHGGGYAYNGATAEVSGTAGIYLTGSGTVGNTIYGGGYASGAGSNAPVSIVNVIALGKASVINPDNGLGELGGQAYVGSGGIELINRNPVPTQQPVYENPVQQPLPPIQPVQPVQPVQPTQPVEITAPISRPVSATVMYIGPNQQAQNFTDAVNQLPNNAGNVEFRIMGNFRQDKDVMIPANRGITSLIVTGNNNTRMTVSWPEDIGFFANGIPTTIADSVVFKDGVVYGGANVLNGQYSMLPATYLDISGSVNKVVVGSKANGANADAHVMNTVLVLRGKATGWLYGGGAALYGGYSAVEGTATMTVAQGAKVELSVAGGGFAFGSGSQSVVNESNMNIAGSVVYAVFLGGYADQNSTAVTTGLSFLNLETTGNVGQSVWYGGRAFTKSKATLDTARAQISGHVGASVHREGRATDSGQVSTRVIQ